MCYSASASFTTGVVLLGVGVLTLRANRQPRQRMFAAIPLLFAVQQLIEGVIWLSFSHPEAWPNFPVNTVMTYAYAFYSHVLWPVYAPLAVLLMEPVPKHRQTLLVFVIAGLVVGLNFLFLMFAFPVVSRPIGQHIEYVSPHFFAAIVMSLYLLATTVSLLVSTHPVVKVFGALTLLSFGAAIYFYEVWFISVWCFFAALLSVMVYLQVAPTRWSVGSARWRLKRSSVCRFPRTWLK